MKYLLLNVFSCLSLFVFRANCRGTAIYPNLKYYTFSPILGECYVMYDESEIMSPFYCQRPANLERQSCIELLTGEKECLGLKTPGNETVEFLCKDTKEEVLSGDSTQHPTTCFKVYSANNTFETICQEIFENETVGIRTPANFIILFIAKHCPISTSADERKAFSNFANNFSFDSEIRSCFKVYNPNQVISPHTCLSKDIQESCIDKLPAYEGCFGIITPNNETVILDCPQGNQRSGSRNCFKIYTPDNVEYTMCQKIVEERCVGIITPSNLTVLLECYYCFAYDSNGLVKYYDPEEQRHYRKLVKTYIDDEYLGKNSYLDKIEFEVFKKDEFVVPPHCNDRRPRFYAYWLPNTTCYGITLENNETLILECTPYKKQSIPGCFTIVSSEMDHNNTACIRVLDERCVGITTPQNLTVALACYPEYNCYEDAHTFERSQYALRNAESYKFRPMLNACYEIYNSSQDTVDGYSCLKEAHPEKYSCIDWIPGQKHCLGLKIAKNETIEFACGDSVEEVLSSQFPIKNCFRIYNSNQDVIDVCQKKIGNFSIGITTPNNLTILFDSLFCSTYKSISKIEEYKEFVENFRFDPNTKSCYKVYAPHQEVSPYTCFRREAYDACISVLDNGECMGISTYNNETIVLNCANKVGRGNESGCFEIYTSDNKVHIACQEKLEESCVGITTPSKLRVLFDCHNCIFEGGTHVFDPNGVYTRLYHKNIKNSLDMFKEGNYTIERKYYVYKPDEHIGNSDSCFTKNGYYDVRVLRGHNNCKGITMDNLETIVLECPNETPEKPGCFEVYSPTYGEEDNKITGPEQKVQKVCVGIVDEKCIGIITPGNRTLPLNCVPVLGCALPVGYYTPNNKPPLRM